MSDDFDYREIAERAEDLILRLRDIQSCRISTDETGKINEVHVVASSYRSPKMIARDVETCLKAELGLEIDYRKIGVVLINSSKEAGAGRIREDEAAGMKEGLGAGTPEISTEKPEGMETEPQLEFLEQEGRVRFKGIHLGIEESRLEVEVKLERGGIEAIGRMGAARRGEHFDAAIAAATVLALTELLDESFYLCLAGIEETSIRNHKALITKLEAVDGRIVRSFVGCVLMGADRNEAAAMAVLDAVNRPLGRWKLRKQTRYTIR